MTLAGRKLRQRQRRKADLKMLFIASGKCRPEADVSVCRKAEGSALVCAETGKASVLQPFQHRRGRVSVAVVPAAGDEYKVRTDKREKPF